MSLVYEALQKAEREKERKTAPAAPVKPAPARPPVAVAVAPPAPPAPRINYLGPLVACVSLVALVAIVFIVVQAARSLTEKRSTPAAAEPAPAIVAEPTPAVTEPLPANSTGNDPRFKLTGIMKMGDRFGAVINGRIVYETQYVDGAIVQKVERDRVTLNVDGRELIVRLF